jgi:hypothetical protein
MASIVGRLTITFDATIREIHTGVTTMTDHPVEDGSVVADHAVDAPDEIELAAMVSNRPILALAAERSRSVLGGPAQDRANDAFRELDRARRAKELHQVITDLKTYDDMMITSLSVTRDKDSLEILDCTIRLRQFRVATVEAVEAPEPVSTVDSPEPNLGRKQKTEPAQETEEKTTGVLVDIADAIGELPSGFLVN